MLSDVKQFSKASGYVCLAFSTDWSWKEQNSRRKPGKIDLERKLHQKKREKGLP